MARISESFRIGSKTDRPLLDELRQELTGATDEVRHLAMLRWQLAEIELRESAQAAKRLAIVGVLAAVILLTSLPVLTVALADWLDAAAPLGSFKWIWLFGLAMLATGPTLGWAAWRRFRRDFSGLEQSLDELREDIVWLHEWSGKE